MSLEFVRGAVMLFRLPFFYLARATVDDAPFKLIAGLMGAVWAYVADQDAEAAAITALGVLMALDMVTGILASFRRGKRVNSRRLSDSAYKLAGYSAVVAAGAAVEKLVPAVSPGVVVTATVLPLALTELVSLLENARYLGVSKSSGVGRILTAFLSEDEHHDRGPQERKKP